MRKLNYHDQLNQANIWTWRTETLDSCFNLISSHQQCIPWSPPLGIEVFAGISGHGNSIYNIISQPKKENVKNNHQKSLKNKNKFIMEYNFTLSCILTNIYIYIYIYIGKNFVERSTNNFVLTSCRPRPPGRMKYLTRRFRLWTLPILIVKARI